MRRGMRAATRALRKDSHSLLKMITNPNAGRNGLFTGKAVPVGIGPKCQGS